MSDDLKIEDQYIKGYEIIDGVKIPIIHCPTKITVKNKITGVIYKSEAEANADAANPLILSLNVSIPLSSEALIYI